MPSYYLQVVLGHGDLSDWRIWEIVTLTLSGICHSHPFGNLNHFRFFFDSGSSGAARIAWSKTFLSPACKEKATVRPRLGRVYLVRSVNHS